MQSVSSRSGLSVPWARPRIQSALRPPCGPLVRCCVDGRGAVVPGSPASDRRGSVAAAARATVARSAGPLRPWRAVHERSVRWETDATWAKLLERVPQNALAGPAHPAPGQELGRSRVGLSTQVHLAADGRVHRWESSSHRETSTDTVVDTALDPMQVPCSSMGRPCRRRAMVIADETHCSRAIRPGLRRRGHPPNEPTRPPTDVAADRLTYDRPSSTPTG